MYKRLACNQQTRQLTYGYEETENTRREELTIKRNRITDIFVRTKIKDLFGCNDQKSILWIGLHTRGKT